jgi:hypothetical protein
VTLACLVEASLVFSGDMRELLKPLFAATGRKELDDPSRGRSRVSYGVLNVAWLECPFASRCRGDLVADEHAYFT